MKDVKQSSVRVRFAPSPTGFLHIGSLRTALFNWLFARHCKGTFLLRIEDTDRERSTKEYEESILKSLAWTGIVPDEPVVYQFDRLGIHSEVVQRLIKEKKAYKCFCSEAKLEEKKERALSKQQTYQYDKACRLLEVTGDHSDQPHVVRFAISIPGETFTFHDDIKGDVTVPCEQIDDFVILRSDKTVTYNFAVVQDDHDMGVTHVIRGEDHLLNTVKQILLYQALGYNVPSFAHIPLILGDRGQKLSKRDAITSVVEYQKEGYLADALCNYLVRLGWSHGDQEIFTKEEMISFFDLSGVHKGGAKFDLEKLRWMNAQYIKQLSPEMILSLIEKNLSKNLVQVTLDWKAVDRLEWIKLYQGRVHTLQELFDEIAKAYVLPVSYDHDGLRKIIAKDSIVILQLLQQELENVEFDKQSLMQMVKDFCHSHEYKVAVVSQLLRFALLGTVSGPSVFDMMVLLGKREVGKRVSHVIAFM
ncbi:glutamate--tRNA ligase [Candidatus Dependentiae bacterium]|nr:glutamate--tRNA ligase [Candidatus Dependentiae bacterium]